MTDRDDPNGAPAPAPTGPDWRKVLHQLNNIFTAIHSSLDLALAYAGRPEAQAFLVQAQASARQGAKLIMELQLSRQEPAGGASLPARPEAKASGWPEADGVPAPASLEGSERILVVEDDESVRLLVRAVLTYRGYDVIEACDGEEAVSRYREEGPFDLVILDQAMPKLNGRGALEQIRAADPAVRALALSGLLLHCEPSAQAPAADGFDAQLSKPFDNTELAMLVRQLLDRHS